VSITNSGGGTLSGVAVGTTTYGPGATGWLQTPSLNTSTAPATLTVQPVTGNLTPGTYTATVPVQSGVASNSPQLLTVTFAVSAAASGTLSISILGLPANVPANVTVTGPNGYSRQLSAAATLSNLAAGVYTVTASGVVSGGTYVPSPSTQQVTVSAGSTASVTITYLIVPEPAISLSPASVTFNATSGSSNPANQVVSITNSGGGTLSGVAVGTTTYGPGATGWLQTPSLNTSTAPATLTVQPVTGNLTPGTYTATVPVQSGVASNSPQLLTVTFAVSAAASGTLSISILGLPANVPANVTVTGPNGYSRQLSAAATLSNLAAGVYTVTASGVVSGGTYVPSPSTQQVTVSAGSTASVTITYTAIPGGLSGRVTFRSAATRRRPPQAN
jgi:hypothetical protein